MFNDIFTCEQQKRPYTFFFQSLKNQSLERDGCKLASAAAIYASVSLQECPSAFQFHVLQPPMDIKTW